MPVSSSSSCLPPTCTSGRFGTLDGCWQILARRRSLLNGCMPSWIQRRKMRGMRYAMKRVPKLTAARRVGRVTPVPRTQHYRLAGFDLRACGLPIRVAIRCLMAWISRWVQERPSPSWGRADAASQPLPPCCCGSMSRHRGASRSAGRTFDRWTVRYSARALPACCSRRFSIRDRSVRTLRLCARSCRWRRLPKRQILQQFMTLSYVSSAAGKP